MWRWHAWSTGVLTYIFIVSACLCWQIFLGSTVSLGIIFFCLVVFRHPKEQEVLPPLCIITSPSHHRSYIMWTGMWTDLKCELWLYFKLHILLIFMINIIFVSYKIQTLFQILKDITRFKLRFDQKYEHLIKIIWLTSF